jgi:uncharacterized membrane protein YfcA
MMTLDAVQWVCAVLGALMVGVSKTAISGLSVLAVGLFTYVFASSKQASGLVLPLLVFADFVAVFAYRRHAQWQYLWKLFPWTAIGVVLGFFALGRISDQAAKALIGIIILALTALSGWRRFRAGSGTDESNPLHWSIAIVVGIVAGFITLIANAAGPLMAIYLLAMRLPKMQYVGTAAVFFLLLNLFKVPFMAALGLITVASFKFNLILLPAVVLGTFLGRWLLGRINQSAFEKLVLALSAIAGVLLLV